MDNEIAFPDARCIHEKLRIAIASIVRKEKFSIPNKMTRKHVRHIKHIQNSDIHLDTVFRRQHQRPLKSTHRRRIKPLHQPRYNLLIIDHLLIFKRKRYESFTRCKQFKQITKK